MKTTPPYHYDPSPELFSHSSGDCDTHGVNQPFWKPAKSSTLPQCVACTLAELQKTAPTPPAAPIVALLVEREAAPVHAGNGAEPVSREVVKPDLPIGEKCVRCGSDSHLMKDGGHWVCIGGCSVSPHRAPEPPVVMPGASTALQLRVNELEAENRILRNTLDSISSALREVPRDTLRTCVNQLERAMAACTRAAALSRKEP